MQQLMDIKPSPLDLDTPEDFKLHTFLAEIIFAHLWYTQESRRTVPLP